MQLAVQRQMGSSDSLKVSVGRRVLGANQNIAKAECSHPKVPNERSGEGVQLVCALLPNPALEGWRVTNRVSVATRSPGLI